RELGLLAEALEALEGPQIRLLHHVSRVFLVSGEPVGEGVHVGVRRPHQLLEGSAVTRLGGGHQLCLVHAFLGPESGRRRYRVSRCSVCLWSQRQYFFIWIRSRSFCLFFMVM